MSKIDELDLMGFVDHAVSEVFDTMLEMDVEVVDGRNRVLTGGRIVGTVGFAGKAQGSVIIQVTDAFSRLITADMLGMEEDEIESDEEVHDVIGELSNMIGGDIKSRLCDAGLTCELSIPSITSGSDFKIESMDWGRREIFAFCHGDHTALVEVYIK
ncbi:MAG: chemotaxis protein CheX [Desulfobacterales bacterium]|nr:chemotaxis protein CheX [Desulfobacterales bacterium]